MSAEIIQFANLRKRHELRMQLHDLGRLLAIYYRILYHFLKENPDKSLPNYSNRQHKIDLMHDYLGAMKEIRIIFFKGEIPELIQKISQINDELDLYCLEIRELTGKIMPRLMQKILHSDRQKNPKI